MTHVYILELSDTEGHNHFIDVCADNLELAKGLIQKDYDDSPHHSDKWILLWRRSTGYDGWEASAPFGVYMVDRMEVTEQ